MRNNALVNILPKQPLESTNKPVRTVQIQEQVDKTTVIPVVPQLSKSILQFGKGPVNHPARRTCDMLCAP